MTPHLWASFKTILPKRRVERFFVKMNRRFWMTGVVASLVIVICLIVMLSRSSSSKNAGSSPQTTVSLGSTASTNAAGGGSTTTISIPQGPFTTPNMPVAVDVPNTKGLKSGDRVTVHAAPASGSQMFGVEARLCRGDAVIVSDGDFVPTRGGNCIVNPLAPGTDTKVLKAGEPPYSGVDVDFVVGIGSDTFLTQYDGQKTVTCDASHPCQIVLKLQYPNGFGFMGVPVTFS
jgi:hypothetical protein